MTTSTWTPRFNHRKTKKTFGTKKTNCTRWAIDVRHVAPNCEKNSKKVGATVKALLRMLINLWALDCIISSGPQLRNGYVLWALGTECARRYWWCEWHLKVKLRHGDSMKIMIPRSGKLQSSQSFGPVCLWMGTNYHAQVGSFKGRFSPRCESSSQRPA